MTTKGMGMDDKTLVELAAKAAGIEIDKSSHNGGGHWNTGFDMLWNAVIDWRNGKTWNPLKVDGDAFRLAVKLSISIDPNDTITAAACNIGGDYFEEQSSDFAGDLCAATRRAIVRCAAAIAAQQQHQGGA